MTFIKNRQMNFPRPLKDRHWLTLAALVLSMVPAMLLWHGLRLESQQEASAQFHAMADEIVGAIQHRLRSHEQILLGGVGLFNGHEKVSRQAWREYIAAQRLDENYPGIQGVGFSQVIRPKELATHLAQIRAEGFPEYALRPPGERPLYSAIVFLEPFTGRNLAAFGFDMYSEATRQAAMSQAASTGKTILSRKVKLVQETHGKVQPGLLMYAPVYARNSALNTPAERWSALRGFVYSPYRTYDLMRGLLHDDTQAVDLRIDDGDVPAGSDDPTLLYDSTDEAPPLTNHTPRLRERRLLQAYGQTWTLTFASRPEFEQQYHSSLSWMILILGSGISLLLASLTWVLAGRHQRGQQLVQEATAQARQTQQMLEENIRQTQAIVDNAVDGIISIDQKGCIRRTFNRAAESIFGYPASEVIGRNVNCLMPEPYHSAHDGYLANYQASGIPRIIGIGREVEGKRRDGSTFPLDLAVSDAVQDGQPLFIGIVRDISERKRMEQMKTEFVSTVSHELRTPLTSISGALGLIVGGALGALPEQARTMLDIAYKNSQRLSLLINDLLDMEKIVAGKMHFDLQVQALWPLLEQAITDNQSYAEQCRVRFVLEPAEAAAQTAQIRVDSQRLLQVLANFLSNAAKFSPSEAEVLIRCEHLGRSIKVSVSDHGPGIPAEFHQRIFQKFSQADSSDTRQKGGTGLGLAITKELVERMGGSIGFHSIPKQGATFYFELPIHRNHDRSPPTAPSGSNCTAILVVEDHPDTARLLALMLERAGYHCDIAETAATAMACLQRQPYAAMTLDLTLPDLSGLELIYRVRQQTAYATLPIIAVSASSEEGRLSINGDFSGIEWLAKPIDENRLLQAIAKAAPLDGQVRILHVEDDSDLHQVVCAMAGPRYTFTLASNLATARQALHQRTFDLVILDLTLPDGSGWDLLPELRKLTPEPQVLILSGTEVSQLDQEQVVGALLKSRLTPKQLLKALEQRIQRQQTLAATEEPL